MHNIVIAKDIISKVTAMSKPGQKIKKISAKIGEMVIVGHDAGDVQEAFRQIAQGTLLEGAKLELKIVKMRTICEDCGKEYNFDEHVFECTKCGNSDFKLITGEELSIEKIE